MFDLSKCGIGGGVLVLVKTEINAKNWNNLGRVIKQVVGNGRGGVDVIENCVMNNCVVKKESQILQTVIE